MRFLGKRASNGSQTKICFATDVHGSDRCFRKFLNAGKAYGVDILIMGGDITGKVLVPIERRRDGYHASFHDHEYAGISESEKTALEDLIRANGQYPVVGERDELEELADPERREQRFRQVVAADIQRWVELAEERLRGTGIRCFITPGNDDYPEVDLALQGSDVVEYVEGKRIRLNDDYEMITTGYSNITPWDSPREMDEPLLRARIEEMYEQVEDPSHLIAVLHPPPRGTQLDQAPAIDEEFRVQMRDGATLITGVGSVAVREFIEERQPLLSLHGHVHESKAVEYLGRTLCLNPGSEYNHGNLLCALVILEGDKVHCQFNAG
jgi:Icc-related predicted phosphoesterase